MNSGYSANVERREFLQLSAAAALSALNNSTSVQSAIAMPSNTEPGPRFPASNEELVFMPAHQMAALVRRKQLSSYELLMAILSQIGRHNTGLNAIVTLDISKAMKRANLADKALANGEIWGPLHGVPVTIKDALETAGMRTTSGFPPLKNYVPKTDATVVARLRAAGAIILGKTNLPTLAGGYYTDNPVFGMTNNPWNKTHSPGGSTGGGAVAVGSGMSPLEIGSDLGDPSGGRHIVVAFLD